MCYGQELTAFVKRAALKVFQSSELADIIHSVITESGFTDIALIVQDLKQKDDGYVLPVTTERISNAPIQHGWTNNDQNKLIEMLFKIYKLQITDIAAFGEQADSSDTHVHDEPDVSLIDKVAPLVVELNNTRFSSNPINTDNLIQLFSEDADLNATSIMSVSPSVFCGKAKKYGVPPFQARPLIVKIQKELEDEEDSEEEKDSRHKPTRGARRAEDLVCQRNAWEQGSECEIYSHSTKQWSLGKIIGIIRDDEGVSFLRARLCTRTCFLSLHRRMAQGAVPSGRRQEHQGDPEEQSRHSAVDSVAQAKALAQASERRPTRPHRVNQEDDCRPS